MELLEAALISIILSGVLWNLLAGYGIVTSAWLVPKILLTTSVLTGALVLKELNQSTSVTSYR
ncbi:MAG: hypothetical protein ABEJ48_08615 [Halobacteriales archaeon]